MVINSCLTCEFHAVKEAAEGLKSHCGRENCWSEFSKCIAKKALHRYLEQETSDRPRDLSGFAQVYQTAE